MAFYVYRLIDPRNGLPFYVGKGSGQRAWQHESAVRRGNLSGPLSWEEKLANIARRKGVSVETLI